MASKDYLKKINSLKAPSLTMSSMQKKAYNNYKNDETQSAAISAALNKLYKNTTDKNQFKQLYETYKKEYETLGQGAMADTVSAVNTADGGYGNDYAQASAEQAYNAYMGDMGANMPALLSAAQSAYQSDRESEMNRISAMQNIRSAKREQLYNLLRNSFETDSNIKASKVNEYSTRAAALQNIHDLQYSYEQAQKARSYSGSGSGGGSSRKRRYSGNDDGNKKKKDGGSPLPPKDDGKKTQAQLMKEYQDIISEELGGIALTRDEFYKRKSYNPKYATMEDYFDYCEWILKKYKKI